MKTNVMQNYDKVLIINFLPPYIKIPTVILVKYSFICRFLIGLLCRHSFGEGLQ